MPHYFNRSVFVLRPLKGFLSLCDNSRFYCTTVLLDCIWLWLAICYGLIVFTTVYTTLLHKTEIAESFALVVYSRDILLTGKAQQQLLLRAKMLLSVDCVSQKKSGVFWILLQSHLVLIVLLHFPHAYCKWETKITQSQTTCHLCWGLLALHGHKSAISIVFQLQSISGMPKRWCRVTVTHPASPPTETKKKQKLMTLGCSQSPMS